LDVDYRFKFCAVNIILENFLTHYRPAMPFGNTKKNILEDLFSSELAQFKKYYPSENLKFNKLGILQSLKFCVLMEKILPISFKLNFTPNILDYYGLKKRILKGR